MIRQGAASGRPVVVAPETLPTDVDQLRTRLDDLEAAHRMIREHGSSPTEGGTE